MNENIDDFFAIDQLVSVSLTGLRPTLAINFKATLHNADEHVSRNFISLMNRDR